ncbi:hypothetical protein [Paenibacillus xanthanilyticus]|uniref:Uncharacterized protein n=1 Tax=Paenibacillus xanthanilyticus TaxID=1783531 RepID=A0ABV8K5B2_9BACL
MWEQVVGNMPSGTSFYCAFLSAAIPYLVYIVNQRLHQYGDPPWVHTNEQGLEQDANAGGSKPDQDAGADKQQSSKGQSSKQQASEHDEAGIGPDSATSAMPVDRQAEGAATGQSASDKEDEAKTAGS